MTNSKLKKTFIFLDIAAILITLFFIFSFSLQDVESSTDTSRTVTDVIEEKIPPIKNAIEENRLTKGRLESILRSIAHATEFAILGMEMMILLLLLPLRPLKLTAYLPFFVCLLLGVADECLQMLNDRSSEVIDIVKDFAGAAFGGLLVLLVYAIICRLEAKKALTDGKK